MVAKWRIEFYEDAQSRRAGGAEAILLRIFVAFEREKLIVLLGAYDKGKMTR